MEKNKLKKICPSEKSQKEQEYSLEYKIATLI